MGIVNSETNEERKLTEGERGRLEGVAQRTFSSILRAVWT